MTRKQLQIAETELGLNGGFHNFTKLMGTEDACRRFLELKRWPNGPVCPRCKDKTAKVYTLKGKSTRPGVHKCAKCRRQFTVTIGTIFEDSHLPLTKWFAALYLMCASKKGISAMQLHRMYGGSYATWWFACHRIREGMKSRGAGMLDGVVELDETYVGKQKTGKGGRGIGQSTLFAAVERGGNAHFRKVKNLKNKTIRKIVDAQVNPTSHVMTDSFQMYRGLLRDYRHSMVNHKREYVRPGGIHTNTVESFFALIKRGVMGTFHHISPERAGMYCYEFEFRYNTRGLKDGDRFKEAIANCDGRLTWNFGKRRDYGNQEAEQV